MADFLRRMREPLLLALLVASGLLLLLWLAEFGIWIRGFSGSPEAWLRPTVPVALLEKPTAW